MNLQKFICIVAASLSLSWVQGQRLRDPSLEKPLPRVVEWMDNHHYVLQEQGEHPGKSQTYLVDVRNGKKEAYAMDRKVQDNRPVSVRSIDGDLCEIKNGARRWLTRTTEKEEIFQVSPDVTQVAIVRANDLNTMDIETGMEKRYTHDGSDVIMNGRASWVYYEEILGRDTKYAALWWAPDSKHLAFYRFDDSQVPVFPIYNSMGQHGYLENTR